MFLALKKNLYFNPFKYLQSILGCHFYLKQKIAIFYKYLIINVLYIFPLQAQIPNDSLSIVSKKWILQINTSAEEVKAFQKFKYPKVLDDSLKIQFTLNQLLKQLQNESFLSADYQLIKSGRDTLFFFFKLGNGYRWQALKSGNLSEVMRQEIGFKEKYFVGQAFKYPEIEQLKTKILRYSENHGYPFGTVKLDSVQFIDNEIVANLNYQPGPKMVFDTLIIKGNARIKPSFLERYLKIKRGQDFSQAKVEEANRLLKQLPYLTVTRKPAVNFDSERAFVNLFIDKNRANQADGILGIQPNEARTLTGQNNQLLLTGELNLALKNLFGSGKNFRTRWQRLQVNSQLLDLEFENPVLFQSNFDFKVNFTLLRQDSNFVNNEFQFTLFYNLPNSGKLSFSLNNRKSNLGDANRFVFADALPDVSEIRYFSYGLGYEWNNLDNLFYPHRGQKINFLFRIGNKNIFRNPFLVDTLYRNLNLRSNQIVARGEYNYFLPMGKRSVFLARLQGGWIANENLFTNDLFRLGGLNSLRGHNENVFFTSAFAIATAEYRLFFEPESYIFLFYDQSYQQKKLFNFNQSDTPSGLGLGISFSTGAGVFNLVYALGQSREQSFAFNRSKIHFGVVSRF